MKTAIYIEDGTIQLVLTPDNDFEKNALRSFEKGTLEAKVFVGSFYDCRGGWVRQAGFYNQGLYSPIGDTEDRSLILRMSEPKIA